METLRLSRHLNSPAQIPPSVRPSVHRLLSARYKSDVISSALLRTGSNSPRQMADQARMTLKLLVDKSSDKVLFAEATKEVVDFLLGLLTLPLAAVIKLVTEKDTMVGSVANLYQALTDLDESYYQSSYSQSAILKIANSYPPSFSPKGLLLLGNSAVGSEGYVKGVVTYMIMDDLTVTPMSSISSITALNRFHVRNVAALEEQTVTIGLEQGLKLLKASLQSKTVLTDVFLREQVVIRC